MPRPRLGLGHPAQRGNLLATAHVGGAQVLAAIVERVEVEAARVPVAVAGVATVPLVVRTLTVVEEDLAAPRERQGFGPAQGNRLDQLSRLGIDDLNGVGQIIGHVEGLAVGGKGQLGGAAAELDAPEPAVFLEQLGRDQVARAVRPPGEPLQVGPEDHDLVRAAETDRHELVVAADRDTMGIADRLALRVERERVVGDRAVERDAGQALAEHPAEIDVVAWSSRNRRLRMLAM